MAALGLVWLVLVIVDLSRGLGPLASRTVLLIWAVFVLDFLLRFALAPGKWRFLRGNALTVAALALPAFRAFRAVRVLRALTRLRGLQLVRILSSINRSMRALGRTMRRRGFGYVLALTVIVTFTGAAGMQYFERELPHGQGLNDFATALWWTAMIMTTMGSEYWPKTAEGRMLCLILALYAFAVFGYVTGTIATYFIDRDIEAQRQRDAPDQQALAAELAALRTELQALRRKLGH